MATLNALQKAPPAWRGAWYYARGRVRRLPKLVNLEFTKHCNASCGFCACWQVESPNELKDYGPLVKKFRPIVCSVSGGEPLLRKDYAELLKGIRPYCHYLVIITNGAFLNEQSAAKLADAGVNQICVSLDYVGKKHSEQRKIEALYEHIEETLPRLAAKGYNIALNTIIMESNLEHIIPIAHKAKEWGVWVSYSSYCPLKKALNDFMVSQGRFEELCQVVEELRAMKRTLGNIKNSDYYLSRIPEYFRTGGIGNCQAGRLWLQATPDGYIQQCSELPRVAHFTEYVAREAKQPACTKCWYTCRGETEAPIFRGGRFKELIRAYAS